MSKQLALSRIACGVCGAPSSGRYFGAVVCLPCKTFFIRCTTDDVDFSVMRCRDNYSCDVSTSNRASCKYCRYSKCIQIGMSRRERPEMVDAEAGQQLCAVCGDIANGIHFGAITCEGCKKFFRRGQREYETYACKLGRQCIINPRTRNACRFCRYRKCVNVGMSRQGIRMGRPSKSNKIASLQNTTVSNHRTMSTCVPIGEDWPMTEGGESLPEKLLRLQKAYMDQLDEVNATIDQEYLRQVAKFGDGVTQNDREGVSLGLMEDIMCANARIELPYFDALVDFEMLSKREILDVAKYGGPLLRYFAITMEKWDYEQQQFKHMGYWQTNPLRLDYKWKMDMIAFNNKLRSLLIPQLDQAYLLAIVALSIGVFISPPASVEKVRQQLFDSFVRRIFEDRLPILKEVMREIIQLVQDFFDLIDSTPIIREGGRTVIKPRLVTLGSL